MLRADGTGVMQMVRNVFAMLPLDTANPQGVYKFMAHPLEVR